MSEHEADVGALNDLADQALREVEFEGEKVLLFRDGEAVHAVSATCPHAGGKLAQGVQHGARVVCPWHKAVFCLKTGAVLEPPAVDDLTRYDTRIEGGRVLLTGPARTPERSKPAPDARCFVIVGAGAAGAVAAQTLREFGFAGRVLMLDAENRVPYDRTVLSKYVLSGEHGAEKDPLQSQAYYHEQGIERITARVVAIDPAARRITCADGAVHAYDAALLAPGGTPRRPELPGADLDGVFVLRSRADAERLVARAERSERVVVLGTGFIGMEAAASLRERGLAVTVVGSELVPFEKQLGDRVGAAILSLHERHGVGFRLQSSPAAIEGSGRVEAVRLGNGERLAADLVLFGAGIEPATKAINGIPQDDDGRVQVDANLRAADGLFVAGDAARFPLYGDGDPIRVEHWRVAQQQGRVAARNMVGQDVRYTAAPFFWTTHFRKRLDYVGHAESWDEVVMHGDPNKPAFLAYYVRSGRVVAACGLGRDRETAALAELLTLKHDWHPEELGETPSSLLAG